MSYAKLDSRTIEFIDEWFKLRKILSLEDYKLLKQFARASIERKIKN